MVDELGSSMLSIRHKIVFVGNPAVGKTSLMNRIVKSQFSDVYEETIGVDFYSKTVNYKETVFKLQLWDSAGQEKYKSLIPSYVRGASLIFLVYDVSETKSFDAIGTWLSFIKENIDVNACTRLILVGNKVDLERKVEKEKAQALSKKEGMVWFEGSAKTGEGVDELFYGGVAELDFFDEVKKSNGNVVKELMEQNVGQDKEKEGNVLGMLNEKKREGDAKERDAGGDCSHMKCNSNLNVKDESGKEVEEKKNRNKCKC